MSKHGERLPHYGTDSLRWKSQQLQLRLLGYHPEMRTKIKSAPFGTNKPPDAGPEFYRDSAGAAYFNKKTGALFILLTDEDDADELAAGQVGPQGVIL